MLRKQFAIAIFGVLFGAHPGHFLTEGDENVGGGGAPAADQPDPNANAQAEAEDQTPEQPQTSNEGNAGESTDQPQGQATEVPVASAADDSVNTPPVDLAATDMVDDESQADAPEQPAQEKVVGEAAPAEEQPTNPAPDAGT
jgi:hypothetical protein